MSSVSETSKGRVRTFSAAELEGLRDYWNTYEKHYEPLQRKLMDMVMAHRELGPLVRAIPPKALEEQNRESRERMRRALDEGAWGDYWSNLRADGARYAQAGLSFAAWFELITAVRSEVTPLLVQEFKHSMERLLSALQGMDAFFDVALALIGEEYLKTKEETIARQAEAIRELSTPVLQIRPGRLIMPLVGVVDTHRARQITEHLLEAIRNHRARVVIIDITGVPAVDSKVANHLIQTVEAARLMGAKTIVTGLSAEVAQTLVTLGVDLSKVRTVGDLQTGIEEGDRLQGVHLVEKK
jgi:rsbT co-antagonist protein RsbR